MIDWNVVRIAAHRAAGWNWMETGASYDRLVESYRQKVADSAALIRDFTGWDFPANEDVAVFSREDWIDANIVQFQKMFAPLEESAGKSEQFGTVLGKRAVEAALGAQVGVVVGLMSRRVLGQYEVALFGAVADRRIYFVEPNLRRVQEVLDVNPESFRFFIALHETTHAAEFGANPWLSEYLQGLMREYLGAVGTTLMGDVQSVLSSFKSGSDRKHLIERLMSPEQVAIFRKLQAAMSLIEGYGDYVMEQVAPQRLRDAAIIEHKFSQRRARRSPMDQLFMRLTGLDLKMAQYATGEQFAKDVIRLAGPRGLDIAWTSPDMLPTLDELKTPESWLARTAAAAGTR